MFEVDWEALSSHLESKGAKGECPVCGGTSWDAPAPIRGGILGLSIPWGNGDGGIYMQGLAVLPLICSQCYFVKQLALTDEVKGFVRTVQLEGEPSDDQKAD